MARGPLLGLTQLLGEHRREILLSRRNKQLRAEFRLRVNKPSSHHVSAARFSRSPSDHDHPELQPSHLAQKWQQGARTPAHRNDTASPQLGPVPTGRRAALPCSSPCTNNGEDKQTQSASARGNSSCTSSCCVCGRRDTRAWQCQSTLQLMPKSKGLGQSPAPSGMSSSCHGYKTTLLYGTGQGNAPPSACPRETTLAPTKLLLGWSRENTPTPQE